MKEGDRVHIVLPNDMAHRWMTLYNMDEVPSHLHVTVKSVNTIESSIFYFEYGGKRRIADIEWIEDPFITAVREASESEDQST